MAEHDQQSLGEALPREMTRVREEILPEYLAIGPSGGLAIFMMKRDLDTAAKALAEGDVVTMIQVYKSLREYRL